MKFEDSLKILKYGIELDPTNKAMKQMAETAAKKCREQDEVIAKGMKKFFLC